MKADVRRQGPSWRERRTIADPDGIAVDVDVDIAESPLAWLASRRDRDGRPLISAAELLAGERFRADYERAGLVARTTMNWMALGAANERRSGGGGAPLTDAALDARARVGAAILALGPELASLAVDVCCAFSGLAEAERRRGWPQRSGKVVLRLALSALARHYGLSEQARGAERGSLRRWTADGS